MGTELMLSSVLSKAVLDRSKSTLVTVVVVVLYGGMAIAMYKALGDTITSLLEDMPPAVRAMYGVNDGTPVGMAIGAVYSIIAPAAVLVLAIGGGTGAALGEEMKGSLDLLLANPLSRASVALSKAAVAGMVTVAVALATSVGVLCTVFLLGEDMAGRNVLALTVMLIGFGLMMGSFAMALSAWTGKSSIGTGVAAAVAGASWLATTVFAVNESLVTASKLTPWYLYNGNDPINNGIAPWSLLAMVGSTGVLTYLAVVGLGRRDLKG